MPDKEPAYESELLVCAKAWISHNQNEGKLTVIKVILIVGEVTRNDYQLERLKLMRQGYKPKVVPLTAKEFFLKADGLMDRYATPDQRALSEKLAMSGSTEEQDIKEIALIESLAEQHVQSYGSLGAVILGRDVVDQYTQLSFIGGALADLDCPVYAHEGDGLLVIG